MVQIDEQSYISLQKMHRIATKTTLLAALSMIIHPLQKVIAHNFISVYKLRMSGSLLHVLFFSDSRVWCFQRKVFNVL